MAKKQPAKKVSPSMKPKIFLAILVGVIAAFFYADDIRQSSVFSRISKPVSPVLAHVTNLPMVKQIFQAFSNLLPASKARSAPVIEEYSLLELFANNSMAWDISTTPIPISAPSVILKSILAKEMDKIPADLKYLAKHDTVSVDIVRQYINKQRFHKLAELCGGPNEQLCRKWINKADPEFGITPLHMAQGLGDQQAIEYLKYLGADANILDNAGRKPMNMSFGSFVKNSKKFARLAGRTDCDFPVVDARSPDAFKEIRRLVNEGEPVLIRKGLSLLDGGKELANLDLELLVKQYGDSKVTVGEVPYANVFRLDHSISTLKDYYNHHVLTKSDAPLYIFQKNNDITESGLHALGDLVTKAFPSPNLICPVEYDNTGLDSIHFFWGSKNSGAPLHVHADAINLVVHGEKKWFVYPPLQSLYSRKHISRWLVEDYVHMNDDEKPIECTQRAGDIIYVPFDWSHAVINTEQTFGYALELLNRREVMASLPRLYRSCSKHQI